MLPLDITEAVFADYQTQGRLMPQWRIDVADREAFARRCGTTVDYLFQIAYCQRKPKAGLAVAIELAYATGLRIGDLCRLRWADVGESVQTAKTGARQRLIVTDGLRALLDRARVSTAAADFHAALAFTRASAIRRQQRVDLLPAMPAGWQSGWRVVIDLNNNQRVDPGEPVQQIAPSARRSDPGPPSRAPRR